LISAYGSDALAAGLILGAGSLLSFGPSNFMLVREGWIGGRVGLVATLAWTSDLIMLMTALVLANPISVNSPLLHSALIWFGLAALLWFALGSFRAAFQPTIIGYHSPCSGETTLSCVRRVMTVIWLNPLTYIEMCIIPSALCDRFQEPYGRVTFFISILAMSALTCYGYAFGARSATEFFRHPKWLQLFDFISGAFLVCSAGLTAISLI
jgi:L-lysine exporter family protein LysE/ArgO